MANGLTVGVDIGGTFTDVVAVDGEGRVRIAKVASTPPTFADGVVAGLQRLEIRGDQIERFAHGTTTATNAILTKTGAATGLLTTEGFRDILEIRRGDRDEMYNYWWRPPEPLVPRYARLGVRERIAFDGEIVEELEEGDVLAAAHKLQELGIESIGICFLNSFANDVHEGRTKEIVERLCPGVFVCTSAEIVPEILEFERTSTTVANAYVGPIVRGYLGELQTKLRAAGFEREVLVMVSSGNVATIDGAIEAPIATAMSGIAAGAMAGAAMSEDTGRPNILTLDVGGTSSDIALIYGSQARLTTEWFIEFGVPIKLPAVDIHTIGAGGGSIAHVDAGGVLHVGPASAGADPGPVCYGRGGAEPTTTDAQVVLGRLDLERWRELYGWSLDRAAAEEALHRYVADPLGLSIIEAAEAVLNVTVNNLVEAIRLVTIERGYDPRIFSLAAFGGAGPMYAVEIAESLEIPEVIIPPAPGVTSALGLLQVDLAVRTQRSLLRSEAEIDADQLTDLFTEMESELSEKLAQSGYPNLTTRRQVDIRYFGQSRYLTVDAPAGRWNDEATQAVIDLFNIEHEREHGYLMPPEITQIEFANVRVLGEVPVQKARIGLRKSEGSKGIARRSVYFKATGFTDVKTYDRDALDANAIITGPAIIEQLDSTLVLPPLTEARVDDSANLIIRIQGDRTND